MSIPRRSSAFLFVLIACSLCYAQQQAQSDGAPPTTPPQSTNNARLDELHAKGSEALYNLDYDEARRIFTQMQTEFPDSPAGPQSLAVSLWVQTLNESRRLQSSLYNSKSFYA